MWSLWFVTAAAAADIGGHWALVSKTEARRSIDAAVTRSAASFPRSRQSMARSKLSSIPRLCPELVFRLDDTELAWRCGPKKRELVVPLAKLGSPFEVKGDRGPAMATVQFEDGRIRARFRTDEGTRFVEYAFDEASLVVTEQFRSDRLQVPLQWQVAYARPASPEE
ncbi:MAG: hypothetical protein AAF602_19560 [Myxococcota bacterium]